MKMSEFNWRVLSLDLNSVKKSEDRLLKICREIYGRTVNDSDKRLDIFRLEGFGLPFFFYSLMLDGSYDTPTGRKSVLQIGFIF